MRYRYLKAPYSLERKPRYIPEVIHPRLRSSATSIWVLNKRLNTAFDTKRVNDLTFGATTASPRYGVRSGGDGLVFDGGDTCDGTVTNITAYPIWMSCSFTLESLTAQTSIFSLGSATLSGGGFLMFDFQPGTGITARTRQTIAGSINQIVLDASPTVGKVYHVSYVARSQTDYTAWVNGRKLTSAGDVGAIFDGFPRFAIGGLLRATTNQFPLTGIVYWGAYGIIDPGDTFLQSLSQNPWQYLFPAAREKWINTTGIGFNAASNSGDQAASANYTFNRTVTGANTYLTVDVELLTVTGATVTSVTDDDGGTNTAMVFLGAKSTVTGAGRVECWGLANPTAGTKTIRVILSASIESVATAVSYTGVHQTSPTEGFNSAQATNAGSATDASVSITSVANNCWIHAACVANDTSITANQTTRNNVSGTLGSGANEDNGAAKTPAGAVTMSYSGMGITTTWAIAGYALRPIAASNLSTAKSYGYIAG